MQWQGFNLRFGYTQNLNLQINVAWQISDRFLVQIAILRSMKHSDAIKEMPNYPKFKCEYLQTVPDRQIVTIIHR